MTLPRQPADPGLDFQEQAHRLSILLLKFMPEQKGLEDQYNVGFRKGRRHQTAQILNMILL
jgi:hypothetical protein